LRASCIVILWNGREYIESCLTSVLPQLGPDDELLVVDNGSADGSAELVKARYPTAHLISAGENLGYGGGVNLGIEVARGQYLFVFNQDVDLHPGWLETMMVALQQPQVGIVGCKLRYPDGSIQHAGGKIQWPLAFPDHYGYRQPDDGRWDAVRDVDYVTGAAWGFRRDVVEAVGRLDEGFSPAYFEEVDYCFRARDAGWRVIYEPHAVAIHWESTSLGGDATLTRMRLYHKGRLRFLLKRHLNSPQRWSAAVEAEEVYQQGLVAEGKASTLEGFGLLEAQALLAGYREMLLTPFPYVKGCFQERGTQAFSALWGCWHSLWEVMQRGGVQQRKDELEMDDEVNWLVSEKPFTSTVPLIGGLIIWFRTRWNDVATRWYVLPLLQQINEIFGRIARRLSDFSFWIAAVDRDHAALLRSLAETRLQVSCLERRLVDLEAQLHVFQDKDGFAEETER
jgi:GT2 family glycosyltransferase